MEEHIKQIEELIKANAEIKERTAWLDSAAGLLRTAVERVKDHVAAIEAKAKKASPVVPAKK